MSTLKQIEHLKLLSEIETLRENFKREQKISRSLCDRVVTLEAEVKRLATSLRHRDEAFRVMFR